MTDLFSDAQTRFTEVFQRIDLAAVVRERLAHRGQRCIQ